MSNHEANKGPEMPVCQSSEHLLNPENRGSICSINPCGSPQHFNLTPHLLYVVFEVLTQIPQRSESKWMPLGFRIIHSLAPLSLTQTVTVEWPLSPAGLIT